MVLPVSHYPQRHLLLKLERTAGVEPAWTCLEGRHITVLSRTHIENRAQAGNCTGNNTRSCYSHCDLIDLSTVKVSLELLTRAFRNWLQSSEFNRASLPNAVGIVADYLTAKLVPEEGFEPPAAAV